MIALHRCSILYGQPYFVTAQHHIRDGLFRYADLIVNAESLRVQHLDDAVRTAPQCLIDAQHLCDRMRDRANAQRSGLMRLPNAFTVEWMDGI